MSRPKMVVILGATHVDAVSNKMRVPEEVDMVYSVAAYFDLPGALYTRVYVTPAARAHANYPKAYTYISRVLAKTPGADESVVYLEDK